MMEYANLLEVVIIISAALIAGSHWCFKDAFGKSKDETNMYDDKKGSA